jgi:hypothetical protein
MSFRLDPDGDAELLLQLARGFSEFGEEAAGSISQIAPRNTGRYARSIKATTFLEGGIYSGQPIRGRGVQSKAQIWTVIYTTSKLGHLLELGTSDRDVTSPTGKLMVWPADKYGPGGAARAVHQPAMARRPHFWPGFAATLPRLSTIFGRSARATRVRVNTRLI